MATEKLFRSKVVPLCAMPNSYKVPEKEKRNCQSHRRKMCAYVCRETRVGLPHAWSCSSSKLLRVPHRLFLQTWVRTFPLNTANQTTTHFLCATLRLTKLEALMASALVTRSDKCPMARLGEWLRLLILFCFVFCITADIKLGPTC